MRFARCLYISIVIFFFSPWYTLIIPLRIMPYTDGRSWARREGFDHHRGVREGEELTDEDDD